MSQNTSAAVMNRRLEPHYSLDYFPTPAFATRAACEFLQDELGENLSDQIVWEPACGEGFMVRPLKEYFSYVVASDVHRYNAEHGIYDFLLDGPEYARADWIFTNPPFAIAERFIERAIQRAKRGVVTFVRGSFSEGEERYRNLFTPERRPAYVVTYVERVVLLKGRVIRAGAPDPFNLDESTGQLRKASSATSYALFVWMPGKHDTRHRWIAPCRSRLERPEDYPSYEAQWAKLRQEQASEQEMML